LRDRRLAGFKFRRQAPIGGYILDFYCHDAKLGIELDGGQHSEAERAQYDEGRTEALGKLGIRILRFWDNDMLKYPDVVLEHIYDVLMQLHAGRPHPDPGLMNMSASFSSCLCCALVRESSLREKRHA
jgi:very-short-patch-repair endonuclease